MVHHPDVASGFDSDSVTGLYLHGGDSVGCGAGLVGADGAY